MARGKCRLYVNALPPEFTEDKLEKILASTVRSQRSLTPVFAVVTFEDAESASNGEGRGAQYKAKKGKNANKSAINVNPWIQQ